MVGQEGKVQQQGRAADPACIGKGKRLAEETDADETGDGVEELRKGGKHTLTSARRAQATK
jgi:hypothetical protein